jgi:hypothetical protein
MEVAKRGRPVVQDKAKTRSLKFTDSDWAMLTKLGRAKWIRSQIKKAKDANN